MYGQITLSIGIFLQTPSTWNSEMAESIAMAGWPFVARSPKMPHAFLRRRAPRAFSRTAKQRAWAGWVRGGSIRVHLYAERFS